MATVEVVTVITQYRMTEENHRRIREAAQEEGVTIVEWMAEHFTTYFAAVDLIEEQNREKRNGKALKVR